MYRDSFRLLTLIFPRLFVVCQWWTVGLILGWLLGIWFCRLPSANTTSWDHLGTWHLDPPVLDRTMGSKSSPSAPVCSHSPNAVPIDSSVHEVLFKCGPPRLRWTTSSSATTTRGPRHGVIGWSSRWHPDNMACHPKSPLCYNVL